LAILTNREYIRGEKGKNQAREGRTSCLATWSNKKVHVVIIRKRWLSQLKKMVGVQKYILIVFEILLPSNTCEMLGT
jgi:hypothetical protein